MRPFWHRALPRSYRRNAVFAACARVLRYKVPMPSTAPILITPRAADLGHGLTVRRLLPAAAQRSVGPFVFFDHAGPVTLAAEDTRAADVRPHPHIGLATVSYLLSGEIVTATAWVRTRASGPAP